MSKPKPSPTPYSLPSLNLCGARCGGLAVFRQCKRLRALHACLAVCSYITMFLLSALPVLGREALVPARVAVFGSRSVAVPYSHACDASMHRSILVWHVMHLSCWQIASP